MSVMVAVLRGVNLGGNKQIKMELLRALCEQGKARDVKTYINSGNVVFRISDRDAKTFAKRLEDAIEAEAGFHSSVLLRTASDLRETIANDPFAGRPNIEPGKLLVNFLAEQPTADARKKLEALDIAPEELHVVGREMYIYFTNGQARTKLKSSAVDKIIGTTYTGRNWNTVNKLLEIAEKIEAEERA